MIDEITGEFIKIAVAKAIKNALPSITNLHKEPQPPNNKAEAIYFEQRRLGQRQVLPQIYERDYDIEIRFEPVITSHNRLERCAEVADILLHALKVIQLDNSKLRGNDLSYEIVDDCMVMHVAYRVRVMDKTAGDPMEQMRIHKEVK